MFVRALVLLAATAALPQQQDENEQESSEYFEQAESAFELTTVWDFRYVRTDTTTSWLEGELGKARYGGDGAERNSLFRASQASFVIDSHLVDGLTAHVQLNVDLEPEFPGGRFDADRVRLIEAFGDWRWPFAAPLELRVKGGMFFPPISLEHVGEAWTPFYTITPSAINAWIGEEVRATGAELGLAHVGLENELAFRGSVFWNNDPTGSLLAYRGWAVHDRQTGFRDRLPVPPIPSLETGGIFEQQAPWVEPLFEIDDRPGYYGGVSWENYRYFELNALYFDNRGIPDRFDGDQYAWHTRFTNVGAVWFLPGEMELLGQFMNGKTDMGFRGPGEPRVSVDFRSWYLLWSVPFDRHRVSVRYDDFRTWDRDEFVFPDSSDETGSTWTFAYLLRIAGEHRIGLELVRIESARPARASTGLPIEADELMLQLSLRLQF